MRIRFAIVSCFALLATLSCERQELESVPVEKSVSRYLEFTAEMADGGETRTTLNSTLKPLWSVGESINVFYGNSGETSGSEFVSQNTEPATSATFSGTLEAFEGVEEGTNSSISFWGVSPYSTLNRCDGNSVTVYLPSVQTAVADNIKDGVMPMVAKSKGLTLSFYNVCSLLKVSVTSANIVSVTFSGNSGETVSGRVSVTMDGGPEWSAVEGETMVTLLAPDGGTFTPGVVYNMALLPQTFSGGFTVTYRNSNGGTASFVYEGSYSLARSSRKNIGDLDEDLSFAQNTSHSAYVDMGKGNYWAPMNVGANSPEDYGDYFAWGETETKSEYLETTYAFGWSPVTKYNKTDGLLTMLPSDDAATKNWGDLWRTPTSEEWNWLIENSSFEWITQNNVQGLKVTSKITGNSIFFPAAGAKNKTNQNYYLGERGFYWSSSIRPTMMNYGNNVLMRSGSSSAEFLSSMTARYEGQSIRPIYSVTGLTLDKAGLMLGVGETETVNAIMTPTGAPQRLAWTSTDESVATVSPEGLITAKAVGSTIVMVMTVDGSYSARCEVTVIIPVTEIKLNKSSLTLVGRGVSETLTATLYPFDATLGNVIWTSDDETVATVSEAGVVTSVGSGTANVTATTEDGRVSASCEVTVINDTGDHDYVEMGDGLKWATMNVGASSQTDRGTRFAWGETETKSSYSWENYKFMASGLSDGKYITKYQKDDSLEGAIWYNSSGSFVGDGLTTLELEDDPARQVWGGSWRTPTRQEWKWLLDNCNWSQATIDGTRGFMAVSTVSGYVGHSIFFPYVNFGVITGGSAYSGRYWTSSLSVDYASPYASYMYFNISINSSSGEITVTDPKLNSIVRYSDYVVRAVSD